MGIVKRERFLKLGLRKPHGRGRILNWTFYAIFPKILGKCIVTKVMGMKLRKISLCSH